MPPRYLSTGLTIIVDALAIAAATAVLALIYWVATGTGGEFLAIVSNLLFLEGGIILAFGALIEFFHMGRTQEIRRLLTSPQVLLDWLDKLKMDKRDHGEEEPSDAGWLLIFLGTTLIIFSIMLSLEHLI